jgi:transcriptional regulator with XRE-family HTH domain
MDRQNDSLIAAFAVTLFEERQKAGLTQEELAERADVSARFISFLETGRRQPSLSTLHALSKGLRMQMQDLMAAVELRHEAEVTGPRRTSD